MTTRERFLIVAGLVLGSFIAGVIFAASRFISPESSAAKTEEMAAAADESHSENTSNQPDGHQPGSATISEATQAPQSAQLTEDEQRSIGLQTAVVHHQLIRGELLAVARVEEPETQLANISARIGGRIDKLHVDYTGQPVRLGQPIAEIYSPEILTSAEEYKLALENRKRLGSAAEPQAISGADELVAAAGRTATELGLGAVARKIAELPGS